MIEKFPSERQRTVYKKWGHERIIVNNDLYCGKILHINTGHISSYHYHKLKTETFYVLFGTVNLQIEDNVYVLNSGDSITIKPYQKHQFKALTSYVDIIEFSTPHYDSDSYRLTESV